MTTLRGILPVLATPYDAGGDIVESEVRALCARIMLNPPLVTWINKRVIRAAMDSTLETTAVLTSNASGILANSEDADEARAALRERRDPVFKGR